MHLEISKFTIYIITSFSYNPPYLLLANLRNFRTTIHKYTQYLPISLISFLNNSPYLLFPRLRNFRTSNTHTHIQSKIAAKCTTYPLDLRDFSIIHRIYQPKIKKFSNHEILNRWKTIHRRLSVYDKWSVRSDKVGCKEQCVSPIFSISVFQRIDIVRQLSKRRKSNVMIRCYHRPRFAVTNTRRTMCTRVGTWSASTFT